MKNVFPKSVFVAFAIGLLFTAMLSAQNRVLTQNQTLFIDKAVGRSAVFLAGTSVAMGMDGNVIFGTLAADTILSVDKPIGRGTVFKGGTQVSFMPGGDVQMGTLAANTTLLIPVKALGKAAVFREGTSVVFQGDGCVISGTLAVSTTLLTNNSLGISKAFPAGAVVTFQPDGTAISDITSPVSPDPVGLLSGSLSGTWNGTYHNSLGNSGASTLSLVVSGNTVTGTADGLSIQNAQLDGQTLRFNLYWSQTQTKYQYVFKLAGENRGTATYQASSPTKNYSGYVNDYVRTTNPESPPRTTRTISEAEVTMTVTAEGWTAVWTQRGASRTWDGVWTRGSDRVVTVMEGGMKGNQIRLERVFSNDGVLCEYRGSISADGRSASGTQSCSGSPAGSWSGTIAVR